MSTSLRLKISDYEQMIANGAFVGLNKRLEFVDGEIREMSGSHCIHRHLAPSGHGYQDVCKLERTQDISPRCKRDGQLVLAELFDE